MIRNARQTALGPGSDGDPVSGIAPPNPFIRPFAVESATVSSVNAMGLSLLEMRLDFKKCMMYIGGLYVKYKCTLKCYNINIAAPPLGVNEHEPLSGMFHSKISMGF